MIKLLTVKTIVFLTMLKILDSRQNPKAYLFLMDRINECGNLLKPMS